MKLEHLRPVAGAAIGAAVFALDAVSILFNYAVHDHVADRAGAKELRAWLLYFFLFSAAGALCGWLLALRVRVLRYLLPATAIGALVWSYFTATWALRASPFIAAGPASSVLEAAGIGAALGALGGLLLFAIAWLRGK